MRSLLVLAVVAYALTLTGEAGAWTWPASGPVLRPFSFGGDPYAAGQHRGIDVAGEAGAAVRAPVSGTVTFAGSVPGGGKTIAIRTLDGVYSVTLLHLGSIAVARGAQLAEGATIGTIGPSGDVDQEPYVYLGVRVASDPQGYVDPLLFLPRLDESTPQPPPADDPAPAAEPQPVPVAALPAESAEEPAPPPAPAPAGAAVSVSAPETRVGETAAVEPAPLAGEAAPASERSAASAPPAAEVVSTAPAAAWSVRVGDRRVVEKRAPAPAQQTVLRVVRARAPQAGPAARDAAGPRVATPSAPVVTRPLRLAARAHVNRAGSVPGAPPILPAPPPVVQLRVVHHPPLPVATHRLAAAAAPRQPVGGQRPGRVPRGGIAAGASMLALVLGAFVAYLARRPRPPKVADEAPRMMGPDAGAASLEDDLHRSRLAVRERAATHRPRCRLRRTGRHPRALPPSPRQPRPHGERHGRAWHPGHGRRRRRGGVAA
jgi:hypothetical protein